MPNGRGFELLATKPAQGIPVIFVTAHTDYAVRAFDLMATDYLLKSFVRANRIQAVNLQHVAKVADARNGNFYSTWTRKLSSRYRGATAPDSETTVLYHEAPQAGLRRYMMPRRVRRHRGSRNPLRKSASCSRGTLPCRRCAHRRGRGCRGCLFSCRPCRGFRRRHP